MEYSTIFYQTNKNSVNAMNKSSKMTKEAARRIQSKADKSGKNQDFKARAMKAADKNSK